MSKWRMNWTHDGFRSGTTRSLRCPWGFWTSLFPLAHSTQGYPTIDRGPALPLRLVQVCPCPSSQLKPNVKENSLIIWDAVSVKKLNPKLGPQPVEYVCTKLKSLLLIYKPRFTERLSESGLANLLYKSKLALLSWPSDNPGEWPLARSH